MRVHMLRAASRCVAPQRSISTSEPNPNFLVRNQRAFLNFLLFRQSFSDLLWYFNAFAREGLYFSCSLQGPRNTARSSRSERRWWRGLSFFSSCPARMSEERYAHVPNMAAAHPVYEEDFDAPNSPARQGGSIRSRSVLAASAVPHGYAFSNEEMKSRRLRVW